MKFGALIGCIVGLGLSAWLLESYGVGRILAVLSHAGWLGIVAVIAFHPLQMLFSALGWREITGPTVPRPSLRGYVVLRWVREAVNNLLPLAQIGGELVASRLLHRRGLKLAPAIAGTVADLSMEMLSQIGFTLVGLVILLQIVGDDNGIAKYVIGGLLVATLLTACLFGALWLGFASVVERGLMKLGRSMGWAGATRVEGLQAALMACYRPMTRPALAALYHLASWLLGGIEVCLALHFLGVDVGIGPGLVIESLGQALKTMGFAVPGALGIQEGGYIIVCRVFGLSPEVAIGLSLIKRLREIIMGLPGLIIWHLEEGRANADRAGSLPRPIP
jgi:putative membrane protein